MKAFEKISASREPVNKKSVLVEDLWFNKDSILSKADIEEVVSFVEKNCPEILGGNTFYVHSFPHLFGDNKNKSKKFVFILSCLRDDEGQPLFILGNEGDLLTIKVATVGVMEAGKDKIVEEKEEEKPKEEEKTDDKKDDKKEVKSGDDKKRKKELSDTFKAKFNLTELRNIAKTIEGVKAKDAKKWKEQKLVNTILDNKSDKEIQELLGLK